MNKRILRFTAAWCGPCKSLAKNLEIADIQMPIEVIDIDTNNELAVEYGIRGVPTMIMLDENIEVKRLVGSKTVNELQDWVNAQ
jgi:thioredoxin 1